MTLLGGCIIAVCACSLGVIVGGLCAGGKMQDLQGQIDLKREVWCGECRFKADLHAKVEECDKLNRSCSQLRAENCRLYGRLYYQNNLTIAR